MIVNQEKLQYRYFKNIVIPYIAKSIISLSPSEYYHIITSILLDEDAANSSSGNSEDNQQILPTFEKCT